jgi:hypothetical protein
MVRNLALVLLALSASLFALAADGPDKEASRKPSLKIEIVDDETAAIELCGRLNQSRGDRQERIEVFVGEIATFYLRFPDEKLAAMAKPELETVRVKGTLALGQTKRRSYVVGTLLSKPQWIEVTSLEVVDHAN